MRIRLAFLIGLFFAVAVAERVGAQGFQGGLRGAVRDPNGVVPGAEVTLTNEQTNAKRTTTSNDVGEYAFSERGARHPANSADRAISFVEPRDGPIVHHIENPSLTQRIDHGDVLVPARDRRGFARGE